MKPTTSKERLKYLFKFTDFIGIYTDHTHNNYCIGLRTVFSVDDFLLGQRVFVARSTGTAIALFWFGIKPTCLNRNHRKLHCDPRNYKYNLNSAMNVNPYNGCLVNCTNTTCIWKNWITKNKL